MIDEEVIFKHKRQLNKNKALEMAFSAAFPTGIIAGAVGGYLGVRHGLDFNKFWSFVFGALPGCAISGSAVEGLENLTRNIRINRAEKREQALDKIALDKDCEQIEFSYRGNTLNCVLREEFENGKIFYMSINDGIISDPLFSYQPQKSEPLKFQFGIPEIPKKVIKSYETAALTLEISKGLDVPSSDHPENRYLSTLQSKMKTFKEKLTIAEKLVLGFEKEGSNIRTTLTYAGENFNSRLDLFANCASSLMETARSYRANFDFE